MSNKDAIAAFGGPTILARYFEGLTSGAVRAWRHRKHIPWSWRPALMELASELDLPLDEKQKSELTLAGKKFRKRRALCAKRG